MDDSEIDESCDSWDTWDEIASNTWAIKSPGTYMSDHNRQTLKADLQNNLKEDVASILPHYLGIRPIKTEAEIRAMREIGDKMTVQRWEAERKAFAALRSAVETPEVLDAVEELCKLNRGPDDFTISAAQQKKKHERAMYPHLLTIIDAIAGSDSSRCFMNASGQRSIGFEDNFPAQPALSPDLVLVDIANAAHTHADDTTSATKTTKTSPLLWRNIYSFIEVKCCPTDGPYRERKRDGHGVKAVTAQAGDYARLRMSLHPFQVFTICVIVHADLFTVIVFDRGGAMYGPRNMKIYELRDGRQRVTDDFIRVIRALTCELDVHQLGLDRTVSAWLPERVAETGGRYTVPSRPTLSSSSTTATNMIIDSEQTGSPSVDPVYPRYSVRFTARNRIENPHMPTPEKENDDVWITEGPPIWTSYTLLGRGSSVWRVRKALPYPEPNLELEPRNGEEQSDHFKLLRIMKTAWRHTNRESEAFIYIRLNKLGIMGQRGIATFIDGDDLRMGLRGTIKVTINELRPPDAQLGPDEDIILHRVILGSVGEPLWKFKDAEHLLRGILAIISGIETLEAQGIVHRDISAGNVLLSIGEDRPGYEAFLSDFEFAVVPKTELEPLTSTGPASEVSSGFSSRLTPNTVTRFADTEVSVERRQGPPITGTIQFMAIALMSCIASQEPLPRHETCHDLEALSWTILYALLRRVCFEEGHKDDKRLKAARELFEGLFGRLNPNEMVNYRTTILARIKKRSLGALNEMLDEDLRGFPYLIAALIKAQNRGPARFDSSDFTDAKAQKLAEESDDDIPSKPITCARFRERVETQLEIVLSRRAQVQDMVL